MGMLSSAFCIFVFSSFLFVSSSEVIPVTDVNIDRIVLTDLNGKITDGAGYYHSYSRRSWLISAGTSEKFILLEFISMETECSFDFVMVFDGNSFNSTLLATISGDTKPKPIIARSGYMLVYLFSDRNYNLSGFEANYSIQDCPYMCSNRGNCVNHVCICDANFTGEACERQICQNSCNSHGNCTHGRCYCEDGYIGESCNFTINRQKHDTRWYTLLQSSQNFTSRFEHTGAYIKGVNCVYVFGGFNLSIVLNDLLKYCLNDSTWEIVNQSDPWPSGRRNHATVVAEEGFYIHGGAHQDGSYSNDLWFYNISSNSWSQKALNSSVRPDRMIDHTLTLANGWMYLIGGKTEKGLFSSDIYRIHVTECSLWEKLNVSGDRRQSRMLSGHTAVFHDVTGTILVYGGYQSSYATFVKLSGKIYAFNLESCIWAELNDTQLQEKPPYNTVENMIPDKRAHHTSLIMGNYMVVYGGNIHQHKKIETCYDSGIYLYHLGCHQWVKHPMFTDIKSPGERRFGHVSVSAYGNTMIVIGGYSGGVLGDVAAFKFPPTVSPPESEESANKDYCMSYTDDEVSVQSCISDIECALCEQRKDTYRRGCVHRERRNEMCDVQKGIVDTSCHGICESLISCESCLGHGQGVSLTATSPKLRVYQDECSWCVKSATCQKRFEPEDLCDDTDTDNHFKGWWEGTSSSWTSVDQCFSNDIEAGLQMIYYYPPQNLLQPDQVLYLKTFDTSLLDILPFHGDIETASKQMIIRITGYIYPLNAPLVHGTNILQLFLTGSGGLTVTLNLSSDSSVKNQEIVCANVRFEAVADSNQAYRRSRDLLFPNMSRGHKYYVSLEASRVIGSPLGKLSLQWNVYLETTDDYNEQVSSLVPIATKFLEPYNSIHCSIHGNCLACMTDASCAWCTSTSTCLYKGSNSTRCNTTYPVTNPNHCDICQDYPDCYSCVSDHLCEWSAQEEKCIRRGRDKRSKRMVSECPVPCYQRKNCSVCIEKLQDECFWCENTKECFPFAHYISHHISGQCQEWVDSDDVKEKHTCRDCSIYKTCKECLSRYGCGWCGNVDNQMIGKCVDGDFSGPSYGMNCSLIVADEGRDHNITVNDPAAWMYDKCLDIDECAHGIDDCDENASCENTQTSYICKCNRGYIQEGNVCHKTCYYDCIHGRCSKNYECECDLGYTGSGCNIDCQCNNQSTCNKEVGMCDACKNNTGGSQCQYCLPGFYGQPSKGCKACECNSHADIKRGQCNNVTGECYCTDNTVGNHCDQCQRGYYGNPRNGGKCYRNCDNRVVLSQTSGSLGSFRGSSVTSTNTHCLWIISKKDINYMDKDDGDYSTATITFTVNDIDTVCGKEHVYVYEGIPSFVYGTGDDLGLLASFCGTKSPKSVTAWSKTITVYFETADVLHGFNGSYQINDCGEMCSFQQNHICQENKCICEPGYTGSLCQDYVCTDGCVYNKISQACHCNTTLGPAEFFPWYTVFQPVISQPKHIPSGRYGHVLVSCGDNSLYLFGGYSLRLGLLNDVWKFNITTSTWTKIVSVTSTQPTGRYYHAAVCLPFLQNIYVFGGFIAQGTDKITATNEMWKFGIGTRKWTLEAPSEVKPVAGHTMTQIGEFKLLVIGGFSVVDYFSEWMYEYDAASSTWKTYNHLQSLVPVGLYGHTAVYHNLTETVYVYGGMLFQRDRIVVSDKLFALDLNNKQWNSLQANEDTQKDKRIFHTAVNVGDYMVVFGGRTEIQSNTDSVLVYHYQCNYWHQLKFADLQTDKSINVMDSAAAVVIEKTVYIMGGYNGQVHSELIKVSLPDDRCTLITDLTCVNSSGCTTCVISAPDGKDLTTCFSREKFLPDKCFRALQVFRGMECNDYWYLKRRRCDLYKDCGSCMAVFPHFKDLSQTCQWCSNCKESKCINFGHSCPDNDECNPGGVSTSVRVENCPDFTCLASTCDRCQGKCIWALSGSRGDTEMTGSSCMDRLPCKNNSCTNYCPAPCHTARDCRSCMSGGGAEGGSRNCVWSQTLQECMSPAYQTLRCSNGNCGLLVDTMETRCPRSCHEFAMCSDCLKGPQCGWCAYGGLNGLGMCIPGGIKGPTGGKCEAGDIRNFDTPMNQYHSSMSAEPTWSYNTCPPENECQNDHHDCNLTQDCTDTLEGYNCSCKKGYREQAGECFPICHQGCVHGTCVSPDNCTCDFGYVGKNCTVECLCNKHSNCASVENRKTCLNCINNTQGPQCEFCKQWFVGNPRNSIPCVPCFNKCHNHTTRCVDEENLDTAYDIDIDKMKFINGPSGNYRCIDCENNTGGAHCELCQEGYFRVKGQVQGKTAYDACVKCQCHGHSDKCERDTGECHYCANNTETRCDGKSSTEKCYLKQCASCKEYFQGHPVHDHQCYRQMTLEREYCLDPTTQNHCNQNPDPLMKGRTVFFAVHPRYLNVDIRLTIDVLKGGADVFFSSSDMTFTVKDVNGIHILELDEDLQISDGNSQKWSYPISKRSLDNYNIHIHNIMADLADTKPLDKRSVQNSSSGAVQELVEINADSFHTYHTVMKTNTILRVKNVESRLVITIPVSCHNLRIARFYVIMYGVGGKTSNDTYGNLYFRQDQPHIDLFVFFSVFFSSFFLFLAVCVLLWKMKQAVDTQRSRQQRAKEMMHMASRPFSKVLVYIESEPIIMSSTPILRRQKLYKIPHRNVPIMGLTPVEVLPPIIHTTVTNKEIVPFDVIPIAVEPLFNASAAIRTVVIQLPGGPHATSKLCLGSTLTTNCKTANNGPKSNTRRRPSTNVC